MFAFLILFAIVNERLEGEIRMQKLELFPKEFKPSDSNKPFFRKPDEVQNVNCARFFEKDIDYETPHVETRIQYKDSEFLSTDCKEIKKRNYFPEKPLSDAEAVFPIAFARTVYKDYLFLEMELAAIYTPQNIYCYSIDTKSDETFRKRIHALANCFPNVIYTEIEFHVTKGGKNMKFAHYECLKELMKFDWKYIVLLQNHDFAMKTNAEIVQILTWMNGTNDVEIGSPIWKRIDTNQNWTFQNLNLFQRKERNLAGFNGKEPKLNFAKGNVVCSLSRVMADFMVLDLNLTTVLTLMNKGKYGNEEILIPTLMATDALNAPGGFTHHCVDKNISVHQLTRMSIWNNRGKCNTIQHSTCIFGVADLKHLRHYPHLFGNKMMPEVDFLASVCWKEFLFNRTHINSIANPRDELDQKIYVNSAIVRYNKEKHDPNFNISNFRCKIK